MNLVFITKSAIFLFNFSKHYTVNFVNVTKLMGHIMDLVARKFLVSKKGGDYKRKGEWGVGVGGGWVGWSYHSQTSDGNSKVEEVIAVRNSSTSFFVPGPEEGPINVSCKAVAWTEEKGKMNVTIKWKVNASTFQVLFCYYCPTLVSNISFWIINSPLLQ